MSVFTTTTQDSSPHPPTGQFEPAESRLLQAMAWLALLVNRATGGLTPSNPAQEAALRILKLKGDCTRVNNVFRMEAVEFHPDKATKGTTKEQQTVDFQLINDAYDKARSDTCRRGKGESATFNIHIPKKDREKKRKGKKGKTERQERHSKSTFNTAVVAAGTIGGVTVIRKLNKIYRDSEEEEDTDDSADERPHYRHRPDTTPPRHSRKKLTEQ
jgi:hypothetical protein